MKTILGRIQEELERIHKAGLYRMLNPPLGLDCSSNDYLGLHNHPNIVHAVKKALDVEGFGSTASRLLRGDRLLTKVVEAQMASFKETDAALYFHTGFAANVGLLQAIIGKNDLIFSDRQNHASLIDGIRMSRATCLVFDHLNVNELNRLLQESPRDKTKFLITESLFSMDGDIAPLDQYAELCAQHEVGLIVDEAHAIGIYGANRSGLIEHFQVQEAVLASTNAMGKAFGCFGSFVCAKEAVIEYLIQKARTFIFSTASPPCLLAAIAEALHIISKEPQLQARLFENVHLLHELLVSAHFIEPKTFPSPIFSIVIGNNALCLKLAKSLQDQGFDVRAIRPPTVPEDTARLRIVVHAHMTNEQIKALFKALKTSMECR